MVDLTITDTGKPYVGGTAQANEIIAKGDGGVAGAALTLYGAKITYTTDYI